MSSVLKVDTVRNVANTVNLQVPYLQRRVLQRVTRWFRGGLWNPGNTYYEIPGSMINITPLYSNSFIQYTYSAPVGHVWAAHSITHWVFVVNGREYARHCRSCDHMESGHILRWTVPSWGKGVTSSLGYFTRQYSSGNHGTHFNGRRYIDGSDSSRGVASYIAVEEFIPAP